MLFNPWMRRCLGSLCAILTAFTLGCPGAAKPQPEPEERVTHCDASSQGVTQNEAGGTRIRLEQGTLTGFGESQIGVTNIQEKWAGLHIQPQAQNAPYRLNMSVCEGEVVPIDANLYRIVNIHRSSSVSNLPGASTGYVEIDSTPLKLHDIQLPRDHLLIPLNARAEMAGDDNHAYNIEVVALNASTAQLDVWPVGYLNKQSHSVKSGEKLNIGPHSLTIRSLVPSDSQTGLRGFVDIEYRP